MQNRLRISGAILVSLIVMLLTGTTFQQATAARPDPELMGVLAEPVSAEALTATDPVVAQAQTTRWSNWTNVDGAITSAPSVAAASREQVHLFARGERGTLITRRWNGSAWGPWQDISSGARLASAPACASWGTARAVRMSCFAVLEGSSAVQHKWFDGNGWSAWQNLGGVGTSAPAAVSWTPGVVSVFVRGSDARLYQRFYDGRTWTNWVRHEGELTSAPSCASWSEARVDCVVRGNGSNLFHMFWDGRGWSTWANLGGGVNSAPSATAWGPNRLSVFYRGDNGNMLHRFWNGTAWQGPEDLGGPISSSPACASPIVNRIECYAQGIDPAFNAGAGILQRVWTN